MALLTSHKQDEEVGFHPTLLTFFSHIFRLCGSAGNLYISCTLLRFIAAPEGATTRHFVVFFKSLTVNSSSFDITVAVRMIALRCAAE